MPRYILTGAPGAGKTAVLRLLELNGHLVVEEAATDVIALDNALGNEEPWRDQIFIDKIVTLQQQRQSSVRTAQTATVFFDRSPVCTLALSHYLGFTPSRQLAEEVERVYRELGFRLVEVPSGPLTDRVALVQQAVDQLRR